MILAKCFKTGTLDKERVAIFLSNPGIDFTLYPELKFKSDFFNNGLAEYIHLLSLLMTKKLKESELKFSSLIESTPVAIFSYQDYGCIYVNPAAKDLTEYSLKELYSMKFQDFVHPDYKTIVWVLFFKKNRKSRYFNKSGRVDS